MCGFMQQGINQIEKRDEYMILLMTCLYHAESDSRDVQIETRVGQGFVSLSHAEFNGCVFVSGMHVDVTQPNRTK